MAGLSLSGWCGVSLKGWTPIFPPPPLLHTYFAFPNHHIKNLSLFRPFIFYLCSSATYIISKCYLPFFCQFISQIPIPSQITKRLPPSVFFFFLALLGIFPTYFFFFLLLRNSLMGTGSPPSSLSSPSTRSHSACSCRKSSIVWFAFSSIRRIRSWAIWDRYLASQLFRQMCIIAWRA